MNKGFIKLNRKMLSQLNQNEAYLYALIASCADFKTGKIVGRTRAYFATIMFGKVSIGNVDTITQYINHMIELGLLTKKSGCHAASVYTLTPLKDNYIEIYRDLIYGCKHVPIKAKGFLIQLATIAYKDTNRIDYDIKTAAPKVGVAINTYKKYFKMLESYGLISNNVLNTNYVRKYTNIVSVKCKMLSIESELDNLPKESKYYKQYQWILNTVNTNKFNDIQVLNYKHTMYQKLVSGMLGRDVLGGGVPISQRKIIL